MRRFRTPLELAASALCLWAAWYHTPAGALLRNAGARVLGQRTSAMPLLRYYSAGSLAAPAANASLPIFRGAVPAELALGHGLFAALAELPADERSALTARHGRTPEALARSASRLNHELGGGDGAVLALFCGEEAARFALRRAGAGSDLTELARELPPGYDDKVARAAQALSLGTAFALAWPVAESAPVTSPFGLREHPILGARKQHKGVDLGVPIGTPVHAVAEGQVRRASSDGVNGRVLILDHGHGVTTVYCHNDALEVGAGDRVARGQLISRSGNTGRSTGPHLHYQLELGGAAVDPLRYRAPRTRKPASGGAD